MLTAIRVPARAVAIARILLAAGALLTSIEGAHLLALLQGDRIATPVSAALPSAASIAAGPWMLVMASACLMWAIGVAASVCALVVGLGNALLMTADLQLYSNHRLLLVLLCLCFVFAESDRSVSVRSRVLRPTVPVTVPWWPQLLVVTTVSSCYLYAGLSKLNPEFLSGELIASISPAWVPAALAAWSTVVVEVAIGLGMWWHKSRRWALALGAGLHLSIVVLLGSPFVFTAFALLCVSAYPLVWSWPSTAQPWHQAQAEAAATQRSSNACAAPESIASAARRMPAGSADSTGSPGAS